ncbi:MAG: NAD(P)/FAD-dependent oxidoreductase, partial [Acidobacteriota bacterium]
LWYTGRTMGEAVARVITGEELSYDPGTWFNSAKFFDLEWQVYGKVPKLPDEGEGTLVWQDATGKKLIRLNYLDEGERPVIGYQVMGIRYRHDVCQEWLDERRPLRSVLENLGVLNFDPEFYRQHEADLVEVYNQQFPGEALKLKRKRGLAGLFRLRRAERAA